MELYHPINVLKIVEKDIWIVDGPIVNFNSIPFPTRMTIIRLENNKLWVHSPIELTNELKNNINDIGDVTYLIAPNKIHYWWVEDWKKIYPNVIICVAPGVKKNAKKHGKNISVDIEFTKEHNFEWSNEISHLLVKNNYMVEVIFFHHLSQTLILTDLIENFEKSKINNKMILLMAKIGNVLYPNGRTPIDIQLLFIGHKKELRKCIEKMINWNPIRIILAHGYWYNNNGTNELKRAMSWCY
jgi:hypothetical protein